EQVTGAVALVVVGGPCRGGRQRGRGAVERLDLGLLVHREHRGATGGFMYRATMSRIFSTSSGSGETLNSSSRQGLSPKARQISRTVVCEMPCLAARPRLDQCVASGGAVSRVSTTTASTTSSPMLRAAPGRGASTSPSSRSTANRRRHLVTVAGLQPT